MEQENKIDTEEKKEVETPKAEVETKEEPKPEEKKLTFDEMLASNKDYQAEFDKRIQRSIATSKTNLAKRLFGREDADIEKEVGTMQKGGASDKQVIAILGKGITNKEEIAFLQFTVSKMEGDFEKNLDKYLEENPKFNPTPKTVKKVSSSPSLEGKKQTSEQETNRIMNDVIRSVRR